MRTLDLFQETYTALSANKARSGLTILGIVIGIASVIAMISIGQGAQSAIQSSIEGLGANLLTVYPGVIQPGRGVVSSGRGAAQSLKNEDVPILQKIEGVAAVAPELSRRFQITAPNGNNTNSTVIGVTPDYAVARNMTVSSGAFLTSTQISALGRVAILGPTAAEDLFGEDDPLGKTIRINRTNFRVTGLLKAKGSGGFFNPDDAVFIPISTMQKILAGSDFLSSISISVESKELMPQVQTEATLALAQKHKISPESPDFSIVSQADILGALTQVTDTFTIFLASVAGISLIVGGIGIMNMMLTTVTERTREIGLRKAIGAKRQDISSQFLMEAVTLTFLGGGVGVTLGWLISKAVSSVAHIATAVSPSAVLLAFGVSAAIGIVFGYWPARRAAALNPIEALRHE